MNLGKEGTMERKQLTLFLLVSAGVTLVDQITKWIVKTSMHLYQTIRVLGDFFTLTYIQNSGIAFGLFDHQSSPLKVPLLIVISFIALGVIFYIYLSLPKEMKLLRIAVGLIFGGAIGNMIDRIARGEVIDFLDFDFPDISLPSLGFYMKRWPTFNVADSCVLIGISMLLIIIIIKGGIAEQQGVRE